MEKQYAEAMREIKSIKIVLIEQEEEINDLAHALEAQSAMTIEEFAHLYDIKLNATLADIAAKLATKLKKAMGGDADKRYNAQILMEVFRWLK